MRAGFRDRGWWIVTVDASPDETVGMILSGTGDHSRAVVTADAG